MKNIFTIIFLFLAFFTIYPQIGRYALKFDGIDDYLWVYSNNSINLNGTDFTIEAWIFADNLEASNTGRAIISKWESDINPSYFLRVNPDGSIHFNLLYTNAGVITTGKWYHIAAIKEGENHRLYVNGVEFSLSGAALTVTDNGENLKIGFHKTYSNHWQGKIDEVRIWKKARTRVDIIRDMNKEIGTDSDLKAYYRINTGNGSQLTDLSGLNNHGTIVGATWVPSGCFAGSRQALDFDGIDDYVNCGTSITSSLVGTNWISVEAWVNLTAYNAPGGILPTVVGNYDNGSMQFLLRIDANKPTFWINYNYIRGINDLPLNKWTHIAATWNGTVMKIYVNGVLENSGNYSGTFPNTPHPVKIGLNFNNERWQGKIDEVRIWNVVRTDAQIREYMMLNLVGNESGLMAYYRFDHYYGSTLFDYTVNGYNGTLTNMDATTGWVSSSAFNTWIGSESTSWSNASNWSSGSIPATTDNVGLYKWDLGNEATISGIPTVNNLLFSSTASPTLSSDFTVNGNLLLGKDLDLNGRQINLGTSGYLVEGNNRLLGESGSITTTRDLSNISSLNIAGLGATITENDNLGSCTITRSHSSAHSSGINRKFQITTTNLPSDATLVFSYSDAELNGVTEDDLDLFKSSDGTIWSLQPATLNTTNNTLTLSGINSFSYWTAGDKNSPFPVELSQFSADVSAKNVILNWQTITEVNNYGFEVERKPLTVETGHPLSLQNPTSPIWSKIGFVSGAGNSNSVKEYSFTDKDIKGGKYQYRLKQIDNDGKFSYSEVVEVDVALPVEFILEQNYPNPFNPSTTIRFGLPVDSRVVLELYNIVGEKIATLIDAEMEAGYHNYQLSTSNHRLSSGVYIYQLRIGEFVSCRKLMLMK